MGLDAAVYKRLEDMPFKKEDLRFVAVDPRTGQVDFEDAVLFRAWSDRVKAVEKRIGNIPMVNLLKAELEKLLGHSSPQTLLIIRKQNISELKQTMDRIGAQAAARGMTEEILADILKD